MSGVPFHYVDLRAFSYETEDQQLVADALRTLLPEEVPIERTESTGHHGDRILVLSARVETADEIRSILDVLRRSPDADRLRRELTDRIDEDCSLHVHLDKQAAATGKVELGKGIAFRAKVEAYPADRATAVANAREAL
jgi:RNA binding exosome subunit